MEKPLVVITGASSGIGAGVARLFSREAYPLALLARNKNALEALALPRTLCFETDVTDPVVVERAIVQAEGQFGPVDCLINCAGFGKEGEFTALPHNIHDNTIQINVMGIINAMEVVLPGMQQRKTGTIINISSVADRYPRPHLAAYAASKAAVKSLTDSLRMANAKHGVRVCNVAPAKVHTPMTMASSLSPEHLMAVEDMAKILLWIYQQPQGICIRDLVVAPTHYEA